MPTYRYRAVDLDGVEVSGKVDGPSRTEAGLALLERDLRVTALAERRRLLQVELTRRRVPRRDLMHFSRQLAVFLRSGIPVLDALEVILEETTNRQVSATLTDMVDSLEAGSTFSGAAAAHPNAFPAYYLGVLEAAELTGKLDAVLDELADYIDRDIEARRKIQSALFYPGCVLAMSVVTVLVLTTFVLPRFERFFGQLHAKLPITTRMLLNITRFVSADWPYLAGVVVVGVLIGWLGARSPRGRDARDRTLLRLPIIGDLIRESILERFSRTLSALVRAGVALPEALTVTAEGTSNVVYRSGLLDVRRAMLQGEGLAGPLARTGLFPGAARQMIRVGEDTGTLDIQLETAAEYFARELDFRIKRFTNLFEPAVIIFMGLVVGFVAIAMVSAMYGIFNQVKIG